MTTECHIVGGTGKSKETLLFLKSADNVLLPSPTAALVSMHQNMSSV